MKLIKVDKSRYRSHLNKVIIACIAALVVGALGIAQLLIAIWPSAEGTHFHWNLTGVIVTCLMIGTVLKKVQHHEFMTEVTYVWRLKQQLNLITRKLRKVKEAAFAGDVIAMQILNYSYAGSRLLWQLDDNTITMDELTVSQSELDILAEQHNVTLDTERFEPDSLKSY